MELRIDAELKVVALCCNSCYQQMGRVSRRRGSVILGHQPWQQKASEKGRKLGVMLETRDT